jgi:hypothetical protein
MMAASFWSLLAPGIERAEEQMNSGWYACFPVAAAFGLGAVIMLLINFILHRFGFNRDDAVAAALTGHELPVCVVDMRSVESTPSSQWIYFCKMWSVISSTSAKNGYVRSEFSQPRRPRASYTGEKYGRQRSVRLYTFSSISVTLS